LAAPNKHCLTVSFPFTGTPKQVPDLCSTNERFHDVTLGVISSQPPPSSLRPHPPTGTPSTVRDTPIYPPSRFWHRFTVDYCRTLSTCHFSASAALNHRFSAVSLVVGRLRPPPTSSSLTGPPPPPCFQHRLIRLSVFSWEFGGDLFVGWTLYVLTPSCAHPILLVGVSWSPGGLSSSLVSPALPPSLLNGGPGFNGFIMRHHGEILVGH